MPERDDDDILTGPVPLPDAEPSAAERAHARTFAELVDKTLAGRTPPAMSADDRALVEVATVIRAASGNVQLTAPQQRLVVEAALRQAIGERAQPASSGAVPIAAARWRRWAPWTIAGASALVAAAAVLLWLQSPRERVVVREAPQAAALPEAERSRPADALIGPIPRERAGDASARIDAIFADRLDGYRERRYGAEGTP